MLQKGLVVGTDYIEGLSPEDHDFPETQKWIDWFHSDYFFVKEKDYWVDGIPPVTQKLVSITEE